MQARGQGSAPSNFPAVPATDDEIREKYLERAIRELNRLTHDLQDCDLCPRGSLMPVLGSGHPQADILLLKYAPSTAEIEEGVAFYGRSGIGADEELQAAEHRPARRLRDALRQVSGCRHRPGGRGVRRAGDRGDRDRAAEDDRRDGRARACDPERARAAARAPSSSPRLGEVQSLTPSIDAIYVPDIDESLDDQNLKQSFWRAFRAVGDWYADLPPY